VAPPVDVHVRGQRPPQRAQLGLHRDIQQRTGLVARIAQPDPGVLVQRPQFVLEPLERLLRGGGEHQQFGLAAPVDQLDPGHQRQAGLDQQGLEGGIGGRTGEHDLAVLATRHSGHELARDGLP
jgi:hypothetical protein